MWSRRALAMAVLGVVACKSGDSGGGGGDSVASITVVGGGTQITVGATAQLSAIVLGGSGDTLAKTVDWSSDDTTIATVMSAGVVTGIRAGSATITAAAGGVSGHATITVNNPAPTLTTISPDSAAVGASGFALTAIGSGFARDSKITWNGTPLTTTYVNATELTASVPSTDLLVAASIPVTVTSPTPGGGTSNPLSFTVASGVTPAPVITALAPDTVSAGGAAFTLAVTGTGFVPASAVNWNGAPRTTTYLSGTQLTAQITSNDIATAGNMAVTVTNPAPGGGTSAARTLVVTGASSVSKSLALGIDVSCAIGASETLFCWGGNAASHIANPHEVSTTQPVAQISIAPIGLSGLGCALDPTFHAYCGSQSFSSQQPIGSNMTFTQVASGEFSACGIAADQTAWCWGSEENGELGNGMESDDAGSAPVQVVGGGHYTAITSGDAFACGLAVGNGTQCWGDPPGAEEAGVDVPTSAPGASVFASISAGRSQVCALAGTGAAYCWGPLPAGDGIDDTTSAFAPVGGGVQFSSIAVGDTSLICGISTSHLTYCWGDGSVPLGDGTHTGSGTPVLVAGGHQFTTVAVSARDACGLESSGNIWCWGRRDYGNIGNGTIGYRPSPTAVSGAPSLPSLVAGDHFMCGIDAAHHANCWGRNSVGTVGDGTATDRDTPTAVTGGLSFTQLSDNAQQHVCALTAAGAAYCWGSDSSGELGNGVMTPHLSAPVAVSGGLVFNQISAGRGTCGVTTSGAGYCWGNAATLGNGSTNASAVPVAVSGPSTWIAISVGDGHACGIATGGAAYCWGNDPSLGDGDLLTPHYLPNPVSGGHTFVSIASSGAATCAITSDGEGYCWGVTDETGQFINATPTLVPGALTWTTLRPGTVNCGTTAANLLYCWGTNDEGQVGQGTTTFEFSTPTLLPVGVVSSYAISPGLDDAVCATPASGSTVCWGDNRRGALGIGEFGEARTPEEVFFGTGLRGPALRRVPRR